jgi:hypothetical protein
MVEVAQCKKNQENYQEVFFTLKKVFLSPFSRIE